MHHEGVKSLQKARERGDDKKNNADSEGGDQELEVSIRIEREEYNVDGVWKNRGA